MTNSRTAVLVWIYRAVGAAVAIGLMELAAALIGEPLVRMPFVTSIVLVSALPESEAARPRAVIGGHMLSTSCGLLCLHLLGSSEFASAVAVGCATLAMSALRAIHPPAGIDALLVPAHHLPAIWMLKPVLIGAVALSLYAAVWRKGEKWLVSMASSAAGAASQH